MKISVGVALATAESFPIRLAVTLLVLRDGTSHVHPLVAALVPVVVGLVPSVWALAHVEVVVAFALVLAIGTVPRHVTVSFARPALL